MFLTGQAYYFGVIIMKKVLRIILSLILCGAITAGSAAAAFAAEAADPLTAPALHFGKDGRFRIMHVTDTHLHDDNVADSLRLIALACDKEKPDLIMLTGDIASEDTFEHTRELTDKLMSVFESRKIPVAVTFGNHDSENGAYTRDVPHNTIRPFVLPNLHMSSPTRSP